MTLQIYKEKNLDKCLASKRDIGSKLFPGYDKFSMCYNVLIRVACASDDFQYLLVDHWEMMTTATTKIAEALHEVHNYFNTCEGNLCF